MSPSRIAGDSERQQTPYRCHSRNHGLLACISSCRRFAAERSLGLSGRVSGTAKVRSSHSMSAMICSVSISISISNMSPATVKRDGINDVSTKAPCTQQKDRRSVVGPDLLYVLSRQKRYDRKHHKHYIIDRSRNPVSASKILTNCQPSKPEHEPELGYEQEEERDEPHAKSGTGSNGYAEAQNDPPCRHNGDQEHDWCFQQFGFPRADAWDNPQRADSPEDKARRKHESKIEHASFYSPNHIRSPRCPRLILDAFWVKRSEAYH